MSGALNRGFAYRDQIDARADGQSALAFLSHHYPHDTESDWRRRIEAGEVLLRGHAAVPEDSLRPGDVLIWNRPPWVEPDVPLDFGVLYEDEDLVAVDKPRGLPTMPAGGFLEHTLLAQVRLRIPEATPMHRLGRGTSGVVLFGRTTTAGRAVQEAWRRHEVRKIYRALASGAPREPSFTIDVPIGPVDHPLLGEVFAAKPDGKRSTSHVTVVEQRAGEVLVDVEIETGRPHQIRIHLAAVGHPLVGDPLYVAGGIPAPGTRSLPGDLGYCLHAASLSLLHPRTGAALSILSPPPADLRAAVERSGS